VTFSELTKFNDTKHRAVSLRQLSFLLRRRNSKRLRASDG